MKYLLEFNSDREKLFNDEIRRIRDEFNSLLNNMNCNRSIWDMLPYREVPESEQKRGETYFMYRDEIDDIRENIHNSMDFFKKIEDIIEDINDSFETKYNPIKFKCEKPIGPILHSHNKENEKYLKMDEGHFTIKVEQSIDDQKSIEYSIPILDKIISYIKQLGVKNDIKVSIENTQLRGSLSLDMFERKPTYLITHTFNMYVN